MSHNKKLNIINKFINSQENDSLENEVNEDEVKTALLSFSDVNDVDVPVWVKMSANIIGCHENGGKVINSILLAKKWITNPKLAESIKGGDYMDEKFGECPFCGELEFRKFEWYPQIKDIKHHEKCAWLISLS